MIVSLANSGLIAVTAQQLCANIRRDITAADNFNTWLTSQADSDFSSLSNPIPPGDLTQFRTAYADLHAWISMYNGSQPPGTYPQLSDTYPFGASVGLVIGPGTT